MEIIIQLGEESSTGQSWIMGLLSDLKEIYLPVAISILTIVGLIRGLCFISSLRDKQRTAIFGFWSHLKIRLNRIKDALTKEPGLINNMYCKDVRDEYEISNPNIDKVKEFKKLVEELETFLRTTPDQMPAYSGWSEDMRVITDFTSCVSTYDICDPNHLFVDDQAFSKRDDYCIKICNVIQRMIDNIEKEQSKIERKLHKKWRQYIQINR